MPNRKQSVLWKKPEFLGNMRKWLEITSVITWKVLKKTNPPPPLTRAIVLLVGGSSGLTYLAMSGDGDATVPQMMTDTQLVFEPVSGSFGSQYYLGPDYQDARRIVSANLNEALEELSPEAREEILANIQTIRDAIDAAYAGVDRISWQDMVCRRDIGWRAIDR